MASEPAIARDEIVPAHPDDAAAAARLIAETDSDLFRYYTGGDLGLWAALSECEWRAPFGIYSHTMSHVIRRQEKLVGLVVAYTFEQNTRIDWELTTARQRFAPGRFDRIDLVRSLASYLFPSFPRDAYYVQNLATDESVRGQGLGRHLLEHAYQLGRANGCRTCCLDVDSSAPAVRFYERLGFRVLVRTEVPDLPVHTHYRMTIDL